MTSNATHRSAGDLGRGLAALVGLLVLVVGLPLGLAVLVGWPLPTAVPSTSEISDAIGRVGVSDWTVVKIVACVLWLAWLQLAVSVVIEAIGVMRRRDVVVMPTFGPFRGLAASLVAAITVMMTSAHVASAAPVRPIAAVAPVTAAPVAAPSAIASIAADVPAAVAPTWTVRPRDTLWGIAERTLGAGERWAEIRSVNVGREVAPGVTFTDHTEVIRPGWVLVLPTGADGSAAPAPAVAASGPIAPAAGASTVVVQPGDTLSRLAQRTYGDASRWRELWEANRGRDVGGQRFTDPNLILVGWELLVPAAPDAPAGPGAVDAAPAAPAAVDAAPAAPAAVDAAPAAPVRSASVAAAPAAAVLPVVASPPLALPPAALPPAAAEDVGVPVPAPAVVERPPWVLPAGITGAALLATGAAGLLASRRRHRLRGMGLHDALPVPDPDLAATDAALRLGQDPVGMARVDVALRHLTAHLGDGDRPDSRGPVPRPEVVLRHGTGAIETLVDRPVTTTIPLWRPGSDACRLVLAADVPIDQLVAGAGRAPSPCPGLVLLGASDDAELYVDLEALGVITVDAPPDRTAPIARALVATLAVSPLADLVHVVTSGVDCYGFANEERVQSVSDPDAALDLTAALSAGVRQALGDGGTNDLRRRSPEEPWEPVVAVLLRADLTPEQLADVRRLVASGGVAVVTDADVPGARYRLRAGDAGGWQLEPLGLSVRPVGLAATELADLGALLADAKAAPVALGAPPNEPRTDAPFVEPPWELLVRLLGLVDVVNRHGESAPFERAKALELVAWLAQNRSRPTRSGARTAMWESDVRDATFANVVSDARRAMTAIATPPSGTEWLGRTYGEQLPLHPLVVTDADLLAARLEHARRQDDAGAIETLRAGLATVQDAPYTGTAWLWPDGAGLPSHLTLLVTNAATAMAERCLALDDGEGVFWATAQGMRVLPGHDELVCLRMHAHAAAGNLAGIRREFESYERVVTADVWGDGSLSPKVVQLRNRLLAPSRAGGQGGDERARGGQL